MGALPVLCVANTDVEAVLVCGQRRLAEWSFTEAKNLNEENQIWAFVLEMSICCKHVQSQGGAVCASFS